jgi:quinolinate synthase
MTIIEKINRLRREKNALILAHNYQRIPVQDIADHRGDSLQLSVLSSKSKSDLIVFCGVRFMAETAAILKPSAKVLLPVKDAGCPMADMITASQLKEFKAQHPGAPVVCYVNSSVEVKAESDVCCTSSNAVKVLRSFPKDQTILFVPDRHLGTWAARQSGRKVIVWEGACPVHECGFTRRQLDRLRRKHPDFELLAHPECSDDIVLEADHVLSTGGMMKYAQKHNRLIIATDASFTDYLNHLYPEKQFIALNTRARCLDMRKTTLRDVLNALETEQYHVKVPQNIADKAVHSLNRMLEIST